MCQVPPCSKYLNFNNGNHGKNVLFFGITIKANYLWFLPATCGCWLDLSALQL